MMSNSRMKMRGVVGALLILGVALAALVSVGEVSADVGPKPTMSFTLVYEMDAHPTITAGVLLECEDPSCADAEPLPEMGPQGLTCSEETCSSVAYGYSPYHRLVLTFSDGVVRQSQVFSKRRFQAHYRVTVREADLEVTETQGLPNSPLWILLGGGAVTCLIGLVGAALLIALVVLITKARQAPLTFANARPWFLITWGLGVPVIGLGGVLSLAIPITLAIEWGVAVLYTRIRKHPLGMMLTAVLLVNVVTLPLLWLVAFGLATPGSLPVIIGLGEVFVWAVEAVLLRLLLYPRYSWREAALLSLLLNGTSFLIGLFLPF